MKNHWPKFLSALAIIIVFLQHTYACTCAYPAGSIKKQVDEAKREAEAIFSGRVIEVLRVDGGLRMRVRIAVDRVWKGKVEPEVVIYTAGSSASCGYSFNRETRYLLYCDGNQEGELWTNICNRTQPLKSATRDLDYLGRAIKAAARKAA
jgi:hypothetical protein